MDPDAASSLHRKACDVAEWIIIGAATLEFCGVVSTVLVNINLTEGRVDWRVVRNALLWPYYLPKLLTC